MKVRLFTGFALLVCIALLVSLVPGGRRSGSLVKAAPPAAPTADAQGVELVGHVDTFDALTLAVQGNYAYIIDGNGLRVVDVSTPSSPTEVGFHDMPGYTGDVAVQGDYAYVTSLELGGDQLGSLRVVDVSTPSNPTEAGFYLTPERARDVAVQGNYAYVTADNLWVLDVFTPSNPTQVGFYAPLSGTMRTIAVTESYVYVGSAAQPDLLRVMDVSTPSNPTEAGFYETPGYWAVDIAVAGNYVYATYNRSYATVDEPDLRVVDVSTPTNPTEVAIYDMPARAVAVQGDYIYVTCTESGSGGSLRVFNTSTPSNLTEVGFYEAPELSAVDVAVQGDYIYVAAGEAGLFIFRLQPSITKQVTTSNPQGTVGLNDTLTYTVRIFDLDDRSLILYDRVPTYTTYISGSLSAPTGVVYDPSANAISGTLSLTAGELETVTFGVRVGVMGTVGFSPLITNRACVYPVGGELADCEWSNEVRSYTYRWSIYLPLMVRSWE